jgi:hypothetical protein
MSVADVVANLIDPAREVGAAQVEIWGGRCDRVDLADFLQSWSPASRGMSLGIWEYTDGIQFRDSGTDKERLPWLERARLFGPGGDLSLRREGEEYLWHFIGTFPPPVAGGRNFWEGRGEKKLRRNAASALLWGHNEAGERKWYEDRVGWADLSYPHDPAKRLWLHYTEFTDGGQVAFVWWKELGDHA